MRPAPLRRTLNLRFLAALLALTALLGVGTHFLHAFQVKRNARALLEQADRAEADNDLPKALDYLARYVGLEPGDGDALARRALLFDKVNTAPAARLRVLFVMEEVLRLHPDPDPDRADVRRVRRRAAEVALNLGRFADAKEHARTLLDTTPRPPGDPDLEVLLGLCEEKGDNFAEARRWYADAFEDSQKHHVGSAESLARVLRHRLGEREKAHEVMDELVEKNPDSFRARLARSRYLRATGDKEVVKNVAKDKDKAAKDVKDALKQAPDEADVLLTAAELAQAENRPADARSRLEHGFAVHPRDVRFPLALARLELRAGPDRRGAAAGHLDAALRIVPAESLDTRWVLAALFIDAGQHAKARELIAHLSPEGALRRVAALDYLEARILADEGEPARAAQLLELRRQELAAIPELTKEADLLLGRCYERLGNPDRQLAAYNRVLAADPLSSPAGLGRAAALLASGKLEDAIQDYRALLARAPSMRLPLGRLLLVHNLRLPAARRNWGELDRLLREAPADVKGTPEHLLLSVNYLAVAGRTGEALSQLDEACRARPKELRFWLAKAALAERPSADAARDPDRALAVLDEAERQAGDSADLRLARAARFAARLPAQALPALKGLEEKLDRFSREDQDRLFAGLAAAYNRAGAPKETARLLGRVVEHRPKDLDLRLQLLDLSLQQGEEAAVAQRVEEVRRVEGEEGALWRYAEAARLVLAARKGDSGGLPEARRRLAEAAKRRPAWPRVPALQAEVEKLSGDADAALEKYRQAIKMGERRPELIRDTVQLLKVRNRMEEARQVLQELREAAPEATDLARMATEVALLDHDTSEQTLATARQAFDPKSKDFRDHLWLGQVLNALGQRKEAEGAYRRAIDLQGKAPEPWLALVLLLVETDRKDQALAELDRARRAVSPGALPLLLAPCYTALGQPDKAEAQLQELVKARPDDPGMLQRQAGYYLQTGQTAKAEPVLRRMMAISGPAGEAAAAWARRTLALTLAGTGDYQKSRAAMALVEENLKGRAARPEDERAKALILALRPGGRRESIRTLEESFGRLRPTPAEQFLLAQLYEADGNWAKAKERLLGLVSGKGGDNPAYLAYCVRALVRHHEAAEAQPWLRKLRQVEPDGPRAVEMEARVLAAEGQGEKAADKVVTFARAESRDKKSPAVLAAAARLLEELRQPEPAEGLYRDYVTAEEAARPESALVLAEYLARQNRLPKALDVCEKASRKCKPEAVARVSVAALRAGTPTGEDFRRVKALLDAAAREHPDSAALQVAQADLCDAREDYSEAEQVYRGLIEKNGRNVLAMNNLAWLLAVRERNGVEALRLIDQALNVAGPVADLLDTRASVHLALGDGSSAVKDLEEVLAQGATAYRYFHLTQAHSQAGNAEAAADAWRRARALELTAKDVHPLERPDYDRLAAELDPK